MKRIFIIAVLFTMSCKVSQPIAPEAKAEETQKKTSTKKESTANSLSVNSTNKRIETGVPATAKKTEGKRTETAEPLGKKSKTYKVPGLKDAPKPKN